MIETIKTLCRLPGPSGWEDAVRDWIAAEAAPYADQMITDAQGSLLVFKKGRSTPKEPVLLAAHMDEVGVVIREIDDEGYLRFGFLGGVDRRVVIGKRVWIGKDRIPGLIGMKPIHLTTADERKTMPKLKDLYIDIGAADGDEARGLVQLGDYGVFDDRVLTLQNDMIRAKAIDDRVGCGILLTLLKEELPVDTWFAFTVQEEVGCRGAFGAAFRLQPGVAVVVEGTTAADGPASVGARKVCLPGHGPVVPFQDGGTIYDRGLFEQITRLADAHGIPWQTKTLLSGGTDAQAIQRTRAGCRVAAISAAVRYIHSPSCVGCTRDFEQMAALLRLLLADMEV